MQRPDTVQRSMFIQATSPTPMMSSLRVLISVVLVEVIDTVLFESLIGVAVGCTLNDLFMGALASHHGSLSTHETDAVRPLFLS